MHKQHEADFRAFECNIIDLIKEEQIKLGYQSETLRLYYQIESIHHLLGTTLSVSDLQKELDKFCLYAKTRLGNITHSNVDTRFCLIIPPEGVTYVHEEVEDRHFLMEFIQQISKHNCSFDDLLKIFHRHSNQVKYEKVSYEDFDYIIYFADGKPDAYIYCIKFEEFHGTYHRFTKADYESFGFNELY